MEKNKTRGNFLLQGKIDFYNQNKGVICNCINGTGFRPSFKMLFS